MKWVVPSTTDADVRELLDSKCSSGCHRVLLVLGPTVTPQNAEHLRTRVGADAVFYNRDIDALFRLFQNYRRKQQGGRWAVVFYPGACNPVSKTYNRLLKDPSLDVAVASARKSVVCDHRLTVYDTSYIEVEDTPPPERYWISPWLF